MLVVVHLVNDLLLEITAFLCIPEIIVQFLKNFTFVAATSSDTPSQDVLLWPGFLATPFAPLPTANTKNNEKEPWQEESLQAVPAPTEMVPMNSTDWRVTDADDENEVVYTPSSVMSIEASAKE